MIYLFMLLWIFILLNAIFHPVRGVGAFIAIILFFVVQGYAASRGKVDRLELAPCIVQLLILQLPIFVMVQLMGRDPVLAIGGMALVVFLIIDIRRGPIIDNSEKDAAS